MSEEEEDGDARLRDRLLWALLVEVCREGGSTSMLIVWSIRDLGAVVGGTSFRNETSTDSSIKLYIILVASSSSSGRGGTLSLGKESSVSRTLLGMFISRDPSGMM